MLIPKIMVSKLTILDKKFADTESKSEVNKVPADDINVNLLDNIKTPEIDENELLNDCNDVRIR